MAILLIEATTAAAPGIVADVKAGSLWGVSMGTTSAASNYAERVLVECTETRMLALLEACPEDIDISAADIDPEAFSAADQDQQIWFLRGKLE